MMRDSHIDSCVAVLYAQGALWEMSAELTCAHAAHGAIGMESRGNGHEEEVYICDSAASCDDCGIGSHLPVHGKGWHDGKEGWRAVNSDELPSGVCGGAECDRWGGGRARGGVKPAFGRLRPRPSADN